jgi:lysophospholipase L1-like esterase
MFFFKDFCEIDMTKRIILLGDSTLDNDHWVSQGESVTEQLTLRFQASTEAVVNLAVDGFTTRDVLRGAYCDKAVTDTNHPHKMAYPLEQLSKESGVTHILLSVGGNNIREKLAILAHSHVSEREELLKKIMGEIQDEYLEILNQIKQKQPKAQIIIMLQYTPDSINDRYSIYKLMSLLKANPHGPIDTLHQIMQQLYIPIFKYAKDNNIPIIDMASSLDHRDPHSYVAQIEPSAKGSAVISDLIAHVVKTHDFSKTSKIYSRPFTNTTDIQIQMNHETWKPINPAQKTIATSISTPTVMPENIEKTHSSSTTNISMMVLGGFIAVAGIAAIAIAFTILNAATFGVSGLSMAGVGVTATLSGLGLFATADYKNRPTTVADEHLVASF